MTPMVVKRYLRYLGLAALTAVALALSYFRAFEPYELQTYDWRCRLRGQRPMSSKIAVIEIADDTLAAIGKWPFGREYHTALIRALKDYGARSIVFDIVFPERTGKDAEMAAAARKAGNVFFGVVLKDPRVDHGRLTADRIVTSLRGVFWMAARGVGFFNIKADVDGKRRRVPAIVRLKGKDFYHMGLLVAMDALGLDPEDARIEGRAIRLADGRALPLDEEGCLLVNFASRWNNSFRHYSFAHILAQHQYGVPLVNPADFKDAICIIGHTATGATDTNATPLEPIYPMVGIYANVVNGILENDYVRRVARPTNLFILAIVGLWVAYASTRLGPWRSLLAVLATLAIFIETAILLFTRKGIWIDFFYPAAVFFLIYAASTLWRTLAEMRKREIIEGELKIASQIQKSFLPEKLPDVQGLEMDVFMQPAKAVGGDLYAFVSAGEGKLGVMVGDVSGKGAPAALFMAKSVSEFKFSARQKTDPADVLAALNDSISSDSTGGLFVTLAYAIFDVPAKRLVLSNGGHLPVIQVSVSGQTKMLTVDDGMPIGVMPGASYSSRAFDLGDGDCFAFYSDGISEARNRRKDEYGVEAIARALSAHCRQPAREILAQAVEDVRRFMGRADQHDDMTLIIVKIKATAA